MAKHGEGIYMKKKSARSKAEFLRLTGIGSELAEFLTTVIENPENVFSIPFERRREIENQMDVILSSFEH